MAFDPSVSPLLTPINIADQTSYGLPYTSNVIGSSTYNTDVIWGGPGGTFQIITSGNLAGIAALTSPGFIAINLSNQIISATVTPGNGIGVSQVGDNLQVSVVPNTTLQLVNGEYNGVAVGSPRNTINLIAGTGIGLTLSDSGSSLDWTINGSTGASTSGPFVITQANSSLTGATNLGSLTTGLVYSTVSAGVSTLSTVSLGTIPTLSGTQTWTGVNTFTQAPVMSGASILPGTVATTAIPGTAMTLSGAQTVLGVNTFNTKQVFSNSIQIPLGAATGLVLVSDASGNATWTAAGAGDVTQAGANVFTGTNTFNTNLPTSTKTPTTATQLITKAYGDGTYATISGNATLAGNNDFTGANTFNVGLPTSTVTPTTATQLITKSYGDGTYATISGSVTLSGTNIFTGINTFNTNLPTSTLTPTTATQLITKTYGDTTYATIAGAALLAGANVFTSTNTFNTNLPTSTLTPTTATQLITKTYGDTTYGSLTAIQRWTAVNTFTPQAVFTNSINIPLGAVSGNVLTSDASGNATWATPKLITNFTTSSTVFSQQLIPTIYPLSPNVQMAASVQTLDATTTILASIPVALSQGITIIGTITAAKSDYTNATGGWFTCTAYRGASGNVTIADTSYQLVNASTTALFLLAANTSLQTIDIQVTGIAATTYNWVCNYSYQTI